MCGSMVDIQSAATEIRRGIKKRQKETTGQKYNVRIILCRAAITRNTSVRIEEGVKMVAILMVIIVDVMFESLSGSSITSNLVPSGQIHIHKKLTHFRSISY